MAPALRSAYDAPVDLPPTLRAHLEGLAPYLDDPQVSEILIAGPDRVTVRRGLEHALAPVELSDGAIRALADRLTRTLAPDQEAADVMTGRLVEGLRVVVVSARGASGPRIRLVREPAAATFETLQGDGRVAARQLAALTALVEARRSAVFAGPHGAPIADLLAASAAAWAVQARVAVIEPARVGAAHLASEHLVVSSVGAARALAADVVVAAEPTPTVLADLVRSGRPFVAGIEAPDPPAAAERLVAWILAGAASLSRAAAESMVGATVDRIVFAAAGRTPSLCSQWSPMTTPAGVRLDPVSWPSEDRLQTTAGRLSAGPVLDEPAADGPTRDDAWTGPGHLQRTSPIPLPALARGASEDLGLAEAAGSADLPRSATLDPAAVVPQPLEDLDNVVVAPSELHATQAAPVEEMLSGVLRPGAPAGEASGRIPNEDFESERTPVGPMFRRRQGDSGRVRRPRRQEPRGPDDGGAS